MTLNLRGQLANKATIGLLALAITLVSVSAEAGERRRCIKGGGTWMENSSGSFCYKTLAANLSEEENLSEHKKYCAGQGGQLQQVGEGFNCTIQPKLDVKPLAMPIEVKEMVLKGVRIPVLKLITR